MFDVFINNWDRFPLIWDHEGNLGNFLFTDNEGMPIVGTCISLLAVQNERN